MADLTHFTETYGEVMFDTFPVLHFSETYGELLYLASPEIRFSETYAETLFQSIPEIHFSETYAEVLTVPPPAIFAETYAEVLGERVTTVPPLFAYQVTSYASVETAFPPMDQVLSIESVNQLCQSAVSALPIDFPISYNIVGQMARLAVLECPIVTLSYESVKQAWNYAAQAAPNGWFIKPGDMWSRTSVAQAAVLVLQSIDIPYVPTSGEFVIQVANLAAVASPLPMYTSPGYVGAVEMRVLQAYPTGRLPSSLTRVGQYLSQAVTPWDNPMPRSPIDVAQELSQAVVPAVFDDQTVGVEHVASVASYAAVEHTMSLPWSWSRVGQQVVNVMQQSDDQTPPISYSKAKTVTALLLRSLDDYAVQSYTRLGQYASLATSAADYIPPVNMLVWSRADSVTNLAVGAADYPPPSEQTRPASVAQVSVIRVHNAVDYDPPGDVYERSKVQYVSQYSEYVAQSRSLILPLSYTRLPQYVELVPQSLPLLPPDKVAESGIKAYQIALPVARVAVYPDASLPQSTITADQVLEQVAFIAEYPDAHLPTSDAVVSQILQTVSIVDSFPDPDTLFKPLLVGQVIQPVAVGAEYPDWSTIHKPLVVSQALEHVLISTEYPDKDQPQSAIKATQVLQHVADKTEYPDKDAPQSQLRSTSVLQQVMIRDPALYVMPLPPRKHRTQISCRYVY